VELIIFFPQEFEMLEYQLFDFSDSLWINAFVTRQAYGLQPKLALAIRCGDVYMWWFIALIRVKMKSECT
jgi:hypothetical protein